MFSWGGNPCCSPDNRESCPRSTAIINITTAGFPHVFITSVPCCWVCCPIWRAHLEMLGSDWWPPCLLFEGSCGVAKWWELVTCVRRGMATLERREEDGTFGVLCSSPGTHWPSTWEHPWPSPWNIFCSSCFLGALSVGLKQKKTQICFESLLTQLEGVTGNFQSQFSRGTIWLSTMARALWLPLHDPAWKTTSLRYVFQHCYCRRVSTKR